MAEVTKAVRLGKVARELNVGLPTIVDFLASQDVEIDGKPNTKIEPEHYALLLGEFSTDKEIKMKAQATSVGLESRQTISLESSRKEEAPQEEEEVVVPEVAKEEPTPEPTPEPEPQPEPEPAPVAEQKEPETVPEPEPEPPVEEEKAKEEEPKAEAPAEEPAKEEAPKKEAPVEEDKKKSGVKVLGKIDLDAVSKPKAKAPKKEEAKKEAPKKEEPKVEEPKKEEEKPVEPKKDLVIRAEAEKLSGIKVMGKIELPVEKKRQPVASSSDSALNKNKRKRKRLVKVDTKAPQKGKARDKTPHVKKEITEADIQKEIKETLARLSGSGKSKASKLRRAKRDAVAQRTEEEQARLEEEQSVLKLTEFVTVQELANMMERPPTDIISACMSLGIFASINQRLDAETITIIVEEFGYSVEFVSAEVQEAIVLEEDSEESLVTRSPIVTVMGHVDHGKTSLLDYVRKANVIAGEAGGITQHIGAYNVEVEGGKRITFLDTPGHEAFTAMRARGAQVTDLAIIVIAADDNVMPQTKEAINHAQAAGIPMIFALNKIDRPEANPDRIKQELSEMNILVEEWGGKYQSQEISAKTGLNVSELLEKVLLEAELLELKANPDKRAIGTVIESTLDVGRGYVTTLLVESGTMNIGDPILAGQWSGKVKAMTNERGNRIDAVGPAMPVSILGINGAPNAGDKFYVLEDEKEARSIANKRQQLQREQGVRSQKHLTYEEIGRRIALGDFKELNLIIKGDVDGSVEALTDSLQKLSTENIQVNVIHKAVGGITESDVLLATASDAIIIGFQVRPSAGARKLAEKEEIEINFYSVIYAAIDEVRDAMEGMLSTKIEERVTGTVEVRDTFRISKVGVIAGCFVTDGMINRNDRIRLVRDGIVVHTGSIDALKRFKDDVKEVKKGYECGLSIIKFQDIQQGDVIEAFEEIEVKQKL